MGVDWRRHAGIEQWRLFRDSAQLTEIEWYWCEPGAELLKLRSPFKDAILSTDYPSNYKGLGQVPHSIFKRTNGLNRCGYKGQCYIGTEDQWYNGLRLSDLDNPPPLPECCRPCQCPPTLRLSTIPQGFPQCEFSCGGGLDAFPCLVCRFPDPPPDVLYAHFGGIFDGVCECFGPLAMHYGSVAYEDVDAPFFPIVTGNAWYGDFPCELVHWRFVLYFSTTTRLYHFQWQSTDFPGFAYLDQAYNCPCTGEMLPQLYAWEGTSLCVANELGLIEIVINTDMPHSASFKIVGHFGANNRVPVTVHETIEGDFSGGGVARPPENHDETIEADFSGGGNMSKQFNRVVSVDIAGNFSAGGSLDLNTVATIAIEGDFSCGGIFGP